LIIEEKIMFTTLALGLCALVLENSNHPIQVNTAVSDYPAVGIGIIDNDKCRVSLVLVSGLPTPWLMMNRRPHTFRVETINETSAVLWIDNDRSYIIPRTNVL
jgi:hypothetical protein